MGYTTVSNRICGKGGDGHGPGGVASYIDSTVVQSALGGFVVLVLAVMGKYVMNRLWQKTLMTSASEALAAASSFGLHVHRLAEAFAEYLHERVRVEWRGGIRGETSRCRIGGRIETVPLIRTQADLARVLGTEE